MVGGRSDRGPALLIDGDCSICKPRGARLTFAPLYDISHFSAGDRGNIERGRVRRYFYLEPDERLEDTGWVASLEELFSLSRTVFSLEVVNLAAEDAPDYRLRVGSDEGQDQRVLSLDTDAVGALKRQIAQFFELHRVASAGEARAEGQGEQAGTGEGE